MERKKGEHMHTMTKLALVMVLVGMGASASAKTASRGGQLKNGDRYDKSKDFSLHFDQEVRADRGHRIADDDDAPRRPAKHRRAKNMR